MNSTLNERIKQARKHAGLTQKELADKVGISQTAIHKLEGGGSRSSRKTISIALTCGVDPIWLDTGRGEMALSGTSSYSTHEDHDHASGEFQRTFPLIARIPLISWDELAKFCGASKEDFNPEVISWIPVAPKASERCFAMKVPDDSMEPEFSEGEIIIIDPTREGSHNQFLVAHEGNNRPTFKQLIHHSDHRYLKPLNSRYPLIEVRGDLHVCGVTICKYKEYE
ncbi:MAG: helix-turn-helix domain-containing protein [Magnetococcales bacterium]|nr:helix-turn-helix domain-containing protein [Magnetococcales bacterium]MBF0150203.1 helix-turn-helix domain-containing protein [Magnetococcales bacterium]MBF0174785.1 helix-turn-helix domain-containing protein [Magnetococcales bacterium]MBF0347909.1 helix-turn-helix domain-containing protein [Magnetococcales bacterium]MBF0631903.1 helix-turn-helix domain-containing protein [Magnetococcales bacterium]